MNGRLELTKASLSYSDLPYVVDNADGSITFDRNRATIERLTAETSGGTISFTGSLDFGAALDSGTALVYRLQAEARSVRVRLPQDLSTTFDANLRLTGASDASTLSGTVTSTALPSIRAATWVRCWPRLPFRRRCPRAPNEYLRGMRFDVRIESASNFQVETSLTRDVEAEVDLRLRGTPVRPVLLGTISINQGEVQVFGTRYTINRGDIRFLNPVKIEPTVDMDLETKLRGITVDVTLSGSPSNPKMNWSSDPPFSSLRSSPCWRPAGPVAGAEPDGSGASPMPREQLRRGRHGPGGAGAQRPDLQPVSAILRGHQRKNRSDADRRRQRSASAPDLGAASVQRHHADLHHQPQPYAGATDTGAVGLGQELVGDRGADPNGLFGIDFQFRKRFK